MKQSKKQKTRFVIKYFCMAFLALVIFVSSLYYPFNEIMQPGNLWALIGVQFFITVLLFIIGLINKKESWITKTMLIVAAIVLILLSIWGFYASTWQFGEAAHSIIFVVLMTRIYASLQIIIASLSLFAIK